MEVGVDEEEDVAERVGLLEAPEEVEAECPPVDEWVELLDFAGEGANEAAAGVVVAVVAAAATVDEDDAADTLAEVAAAPVHVEVRMADRRDPTLLLETQIPATLLLMS